VLSAGVGTTATGIRQVGKILSVGLTTVSSILKRVGKNVVTGAVITPVLDAVYVAAGATLVVLTVVVATTAGLTKRASKALSVVLSPVALVTKRVGKFLASLVEILTGPTDEGEIGIEVIPGPEIAPTPPSSVPPIPDTEHLGVEPIPAGTRARLWELSVEYSDANPWRVTKWAPDTDILGQPEEDDS
jgi:hypothetical protein